MKQEDKQSDIWDEDTIRRRAADLKRFCPFIECTPVPHDSPVFAPRRAIFNKILSSLAVGQWIALVGPRMIGKTTLLHHLASELTPRRAVYADLSLLSCDSTDKGATHILKSFFHTLFGSGRAEVVVQSTPNTPMEIAEELITIAHQQFQGNLTLLLDEFHPHLELLRFLRMLFHHGVITVVSAGIVDPLELYYDGYASPYNVAEFVPLDVLDKEEAGALVTRGFAKSDVKISNATIETLLLISGCSPPILQHLCKWIYEYGKNKVPHEVDLAPEEMVTEVECSDFRIQRLFYPDAYIHDKDVLQLICDLLMGRPVEGQLLNPTVRRAFRFGLISIASGKPRFVSPIQRHFLAKEIIHFASNLDTIEVDEKIKSTLASIRPATVSMAFIGRQELHMSQDKITVRGIVGPVNIKSKLDNAVQIAAQLSKARSEEIAEWQILITELRTLLENNAQIGAEEAERIAQSVETVAGELRKKATNKRFLSLTLEGLQEAAKAVEAIAPAVFSVVAKIVAFASRVGLG